jgi:hypothetical protein
MAMINTEFGNVNNCNTGHAPLSYVDLTACTQKEGVV